MPPTLDIIPPLSDTRFASTDRPSERLLHAMSVERYWADLVRALEAPDQLDPESLVGFAGSQIRTIDAQLVNARNNIAHRDRRSRALSAALDAVTRWHSQNPNVSRTNANALNLENVTLATNPQTGQPCSIASLLTEAGLDASQFRTSGTRMLYGSENASDLEGLRSRLTRAVEDNNRGSEQDTLLMQSLVNRRGQIIQLTTNLMSALHESQKAILQNVRA